MKRLLLVGTLALSSMQVFASDLTLDSVKIQTSECTKVVTRGEAIAVPSDSVTALSGALGAAIGAGVGNALQQYFEVNGYVARGSVPQMTGSAIGSAVGATLGVKSSSNVEGIIKDIAGTSTSKEVINVTEDVVNYECDVSFVDRGVRLDIEVHHTEPIKVGERINLIGDSNTKVFKAASN